MKSEYDFGDARPNPYSQRLKKQVTIRLGVDTVDHTIPITPELVAAAGRAKADPGQTMSRADVLARMTQTTSQRQSA